MTATMRVMKGLVVGAGLTFAGAAAANHPDTGDRVLNLGDLAPGNTVLNEQVSGEFSDTWEFSLDGQSSLITVAGNKQADSQFNIDGLTLALYDSTDTQLFTVGGDEIFGPYTLEGGDYYAVIEGDTTGRHGGMYKWILNVTAVPEAEAWLMMLGGLGLLAIGGRMRRNGAADAAVAA